VLQVKLTQSFRGSYKLALGRSYVKLLAKLEVSSQWSYEKLHAKLEVSFLRSYAKLHVKVEVSALQSYIEVSCEASLFSSSRAKFFS